MKRIGLLSAVYWLLSLNLTLIVVAQTARTDQKTAQSLRETALRYYDAGEFEDDVVVECAGGADGSGACG